MPYMATTKDRTLQLELQTYLNFGIPGVLGLRTRMWDLGVELSKNSESPNKEDATIIPRPLVYKVMQDFYHRQL